MVTEFQAIGTADEVRRRLQRYRDVGISTLNVRPIPVQGGPTGVEALERIVELAGP